MNRREFLFLRTDNRQRVVELSCEHLYMQYLDVQLTWGLREDPIPSEDQAWGGEPPAVFEARSTEQLFEDIERDLGRADLLRILEPQWLATEPLGRHVEALIASFRSHGGKVELCERRTLSRVRLTRRQWAGPSGTK